MPSFFTHRRPVLGPPFLIAIALTAGCAGSRTVNLNPDPAASQRVVWRNDRASTFSVQANRVAVSLPGRRVMMGVRVPFLVQVYNGTTGEFDFGPDDIALDMEGTPIAIPIRDDLAMEANSRASSSKFFLALGSVLRGMGTGSAATSETSGNVSGVDASGRSFTGTYRETTVDHAKQQEAERLDAAEYRQNVAAIDRRLEETMQRYENTYLGRNTLAPGEGCGGEILVTLPWCGKPSCALHMIVRTGGETHAFTFDVSRP